MPKFIMTELVEMGRMITARLGAGNGLGAVNNVDDREVGKFVRQIAESRFDLCSVGTEIEGQIAALEVSTQDGFSIGTVQTGRRFDVTFDGLQATPGAGVITIGSYVVCGTAVVKGTALIVPARVCLATAAGSSLNYKWRVVSLGAAGTGAVGTTGLIERI